MEEPGYLISVYEEEETYLRKLCGEHHYLRMSYGYKDKRRGMSFITEGASRAGEPDLSNRLAPPFAPVGNTGVQEECERLGRNRYRRKASKQRSRWRKSRKKVCFSFHKNMREGCTAIEGMQPDCVVIRINKDSGVFNCRDGEAMSFIE